MFNRIILIGVTGAALLLGGCASSPAYKAKRATLDDPRMKCAELELITKGYQVDASIQRPGRFVATRQFTGGNYYRAAITAAIDDEGNTLELWTRYITPDETTVVATPAPAGTMLMDAMEIENRCEKRK